MLCCCCAPSAKVGHWRKICKRRPATSSGGISCENKGRIFYGAARKMSELIVWQTGRAGARCGIDLMTVANRGRGADRSACHHMAHRQPPFCLVSPTRHVLWLPQEVAETKNSITQPAPSHPQEHAVTMPRHPAAQAPAGKGAGMAVVTLCSENPFQRNTRHL